MFFQTHLIVMVMALEFDGTMMALVYAPYSTVRVCTVPALDCAVNEVPATQLEPSAEWYSVAVAVAGDTALT